MAGLTEIIWLYFNRLSSVKSKENSADATNFCFCGKFNLSKILMKHTLISANFLLFIHFHINLNSIFSSDFAFSKFAIFWSHYIFRSTLSSYSYLDFSLILLLFLHASQQLTPIWSSCALQVSLSKLSFIFFVCFQSFFLGLLQSSRSWWMGDLLSMEVIWILTSCQTAEGHGLLCRHNCFCIWSCLFSLHLLNNLVCL